MKLGISTYTFTWAIGVPGYPKPDNPMDVIALLKQAYEYGVKVVQICDNIPLHTLSREELTAIRDLSAQLGIQLEIGTRGVEPEHLLKYLEICTFLGSNFLRTILQKNNAYVSISEAAELLREVMPEFEKARVQVAVENHERHKVAELVSLVEEINSPWLGICMDTVNSFGALEGLYYVIDKLAPYTVNLHMKDFKIQRLNHMMGFEISGTPAGKGQLNLDYAISEIRKHGKDPNIILELWTPYAGDINSTVQKEKDWADQSIEYLKNYI
ncbi:MAG TPA: sugar phosphate isomerase/epimerase [Clostridiales bacterium]|nr:sugar phosphate isomerase/epimerase [Clostridiales bacterium]